MKIKGEEKFPGPIDWVAYTGQYFIMALLPVELTPNHAQLEALDAAVQMVEITLIGPKIALQPGVKQKFSYKLFLGPKEVNTLKGADPRLAKAVNFGWFDVIAQPLLVCLKFFYRYLHNYGVAIILLTLLIKILFWPLTHKSYVSMKAMKKLQPKMQKIREKYKDDKEKMNQEIMQMYRTHKVNPVGGCLPMVLQIPVFFALYRLLYSSIAMRHAPFLWWINDLSAPDRFPIGVQIPYLGDGLPILTVLMGVSMYVQQKMSPTGGDPKMEKMMMMMPVVFTVFFVNFPSGLVLYWLVNNVLSVGQQYYINKKTA
jgi:YidC/Oxa1 family membrane protein insertase